MKNIHVLPTDKTSRLVLDVNNNLALAFNKSIEENALYKRTIYITSDEEIKVSDYVYDSDINIVLQINNSEALKRYVENGRVFWYKIILTTDQDLIKDGVQEIDDEFLEWFCSKNGNVDYVEVINEPYEAGNIYQNNWFDYYKITIPKEEPKQDLLISIAPTKIPSSIISGNVTQGVEPVRSNSYIVRTKPKQETLEEAAERFVNNRFSKQISGDKTYPDIYASKEAIVESHILFAKWQTERSCSEEEVQKLIKIIEWYDEESDVRPDYFKEEDGLTLFEWFEQFKKK
jgi:hypothetical protein